MENIEFDRIRDTFSRIAEAKEKLYQAIPSSLATESDRQKVMPIVLAFWEKRESFFVLR